MRPVKIPLHIKHLWQPLTSIETQIHVVKEGYAFLLKGKPDVSVIIPAYNEEENILRTLTSLVLNKTNFAVEIIVVNNNSVDNTENLLQACNVNYINEAKQGITAARNAGLQVAKGKYILNADADAIYPSAWIDEMVKPLSASKKTAVTYGRFSFLPTGKTGRFTYFFYEHMADLLRIINKNYKEEAVNVYGFNSGFKREQGLAVNGFDHPPGTNEDGYLALKLRDQGFGKMHYVTSPKALVWVSDRRIQADGGLLEATKKRFTRVFFSSRYKETRTDL